MLQRLLTLYARFLENLMALFLAVMVALVFGNVVLRYGFNSGITLSEELSRWLFVWLTFLGAIVAMKDGAHLGSDSLISRLPLAGQKICFVLGHLLMLYVCWLLFKGAKELVQLNLEATSAVMEVSMAWFFAGGMVCAASGALILLERLARFALGQLDARELIGVRESEEEPIDAPAPLK